MPRMEGSGAARILVVKVRTRSVQASAKSLQERIVFMIECPTSMVCEADVWTALDERDEQEIQAHEAKIGVFVPVNDWRIRKMLNERSVKGAMAGRAVHFSVPKFAVHFVNR